MSEQDPELEAFSKFIVALEPWLGKVVLVGGWAHRLYRLDPRARKLDYLPLTTLDGDVAVPAKLKKEESTVRKRLLEAGLEEEFVGEDRPPATHYHYGKRGGFYAEFLAPLEGSEYDRDGKRKATKEVGGVSSQLLRYIDVLLVSPWSFRFGDIAYPFSSPSATFRQSGKFPGTENPHPWAAGLQRQGQRPAVHTRYNRGLLGDAVRIAKAFPKRRCAEPTSAKDSRARKSRGDALRKGHGHDSRSGSNSRRAEVEPGKTR